MIVIKFRDAFVVLSGYKRVYVVDPEIPACSCPAYILNGDCKHIRAVQRAIREGNIIESEDQALELLKGVRSEE